MEIKKSPFLSPNLGEGGNGRMEKWEKNREIVGDEKMGEWGKVGDGLRALFILHLADK